MAKVAPFAGWRYNVEKFAALADVVVPPYDVISAEELARLQNKNPYNFSRIILPEGENKHRNAAELFRRWQQEKVFVQDSSPRFYFYRQKFHLLPHELFCQNLDGKTELSRTGIFCRVGVEDYTSRVILPHERTFSGPKADRYLLMDAARGNMEPVFLGYDSLDFSGDEFSRAVGALKPDMSFRDSGGVTHELWALADGQIQGAVAASMKNLKFYILDGHHRYETALKFYKDRGGASAAYVLADVCSLKQIGAVILPTHRALKGIPDLNAASLATKLSRHGVFHQNLSLAQLEEKMRKTQAPTFGFRFASGNYSLMVCGSRSGAQLDLEILHGEILPALNGGKPLEEEQIGYFKDIRELEEQISQGRFQLEILVKPSSTNEVMETAEQGKVMPHKSTFFYPKIPSGLVVNLFE